MKMKIQYVGHSAFHISTDIANRLLSIITDPWFDKGSFILNGHDILRITGTNK